MTPDESLWRRLPLEKLEAMLKAERDLEMNRNWPPPELSRHTAMLKVYRERKAQPPCLSLSAS